MSKNTQHPLVFIVGPTAVGKSRFSLEQAQKHGATILNADSVQVYKNLNIGTAKPRVEDRKLIPHELFDFISPPTVYTAGQYYEDARQVLKRLLPQRPVFVVGGSGFYIRALKKGMYPVEEPPEAQVREWKRLWAGKSNEQLYRELSEVDASYARKLSANDRYRIERALQLIYHHRKTMTVILEEFERIQKSQEIPYRSLTIGFYLERDELRQRVEKRTKTMLEQGLIEEVEQLCRDGWESWKPLSSVGYKEVLRYLKGELQRPELEYEISKNTMRLAKRQMTWFRKDPDVQWYEAQRAGLQKAEAVLTGQE